MCKENKGSFGFMNRDLTCHQNKLHYVTLLCETYGGKIQFAEDSQQWHACDDIEVKKSWIIFSASD